MKRLLFFTLILLIAGCTGAPEGPVEPAAMQEPPQQGAPLAEPEPSSEQEAEATILDITKGESGTHLGDVVSMLPSDLPLPDDYEILVKPSTGYTKTETNLQVVFDYRTNEDEAAIFEMYKAYVNGKGSFTITEKIEPLRKMSALSMNPYQMFDVTLQESEQGGLHVTVMMAYTKF